MVDQNRFDRGQWDNAEGGSRRSRDTRAYGSDAGMRPNDFAFDEEDEQYDGRQRYYRSRPPMPRGEAGSQARPPRGPAARQRENEGRERENMPERQNDDWAQQVRQNWQRGPYRDYGWESGESVLPQFRDPDVHRTPEEEQDYRAWQDRQRQAGPGPDFRRAYDAEHVRGLPSGEEQRHFAEGPGFGRQSWNVPGPHRGRGPRTYQRSNERILEDINERLTEHGEIDATDVEVRVENGEVWLTGTVDSRQAKRLAEDVADSVSGVKDIHNELRIQRGQGGQGG